MKTTTAIPFLTLSLATALMSVQAISQQPTSPPSIPEFPVAPPPPLTRANTPKPKPAEKAVLDLFQKYEVVGMDVDHGNKDMNNFIFALIRNPDLPNRVNDIAVECGNSLYQPILDRYIAGEDVPFAEVRKVWRDTTQYQMWGLSSFCEAFFPLVRQINQSLPPGKKLRVLATDSAIDWSKIKTREDLKKYGGEGRDKTIASVMEKEVLSKHRKALMLFGNFHLFHSMKNSAVNIYEKNYPGVTYVISDHGGFGRNVPAAAKYNAELEKRLASWPVPSLVNIKGSWLEGLDFAYFWPPLMIRQPSGEFKLGYPEGLSAISKAADGFLYLGPGDLLLSEHIPAGVYMDQDHIAELRRRAAIFGDGNAIDNRLAEEKASGGGF